MTTAAILIPAHNEAGCILDTLKSILTQSRKPELVVVVDDFSSDGTGRLIRKNFPEVVVLRPPQNLGSKAKAQNFGLFYRNPDGKRKYIIRTDVVITIDADTTLKHDALERMLEEFDMKPDLKAACGTVIPANPDNPFTLGRLGEYLFAFCLPKRIQQAYGGNIYIVSGCFGCYRTKELRARGGWHTTTMAEDMDLTADYQAKGWRVSYVHDAICYPIEPFNWKTYKDQMQRWSAAFFQNISLHWKDYGTNPFGFFVAVSYLDAGLGGLEFLFLPILAFLIGWQKVLFGFILWDFFAICVPILYMGWELGMTKKALASIPFVFFLRLLNIYFWFEAMWKEWICRKHMTVYVKGH